MDKLLSQLSALTGANLTAGTILYAINAAGTVEGQVTIQDIIDLANSTGNNVKTVKYTIGVAGVANCDYNFSSAANMAEQTIQLGATTIIPINSYPSYIAVKAEAGLNLGAASHDVGRNPNSDEYLAAATLDTTNQVATYVPVDGTANFFIAASSVYFSMTPGVNWNTLTAGKWTIWITYIDNSAL